MKKDKRITIAEYLKAIQFDLKSIEEADSYTSEYLTHVGMGGGHSCDSSDRNEERVKVVLETEREFVQQNKKKILAMAAQKLRNEIEELRGCLQ